MSSIIPHNPSRDNCFVVRSWNGQTIRMRAGRVCLTDLCKAGETDSGNPIRFAHWFESDATQRFLLHRSSVTDREVLSIGTVNDNAENSALIIRESQRGDAWGDEVVALKLAGRLSVELEHEVYRWYAETRVSQVRDTQPRPPALNPAAPFIEAAEGLDLIYDMLEKRGLADDRYRIEHKRDLKVLASAIMLATTNTPPGASNVLSPVEKLPKFQERSVDVELPLTIVEFASCYLTAAESSLINKHDRSLGRAVAPRYRERHGEEPGETNHLSTKAQQLRQSRGLPLFGLAKNGNAIKPKTYLPRDWDLIVQVLREQGIIRPDRHAELLVECQQFRPTDLPTDQ